MPNGQTRMEWLRTGPASRKPKGLASQIEKIAFLKELGAESLNLGISALYLKSLARQMLYRKPATLRRMRSERKHLEIACFLRLLLLRLTDIGQIGSASCRERVCQYVSIAGFAVSLKKKKA